MDFEVVHVNSAVETEDDINNAITAIRRNGVALKGKQNPFFQCHKQSMKTWKAEHSCEKHVVCNKTLTQKFNCDIT